MSTTLTSDICVCFLDHLPIKIQTHITFAYEIQMEHTLVHWNLLSIAKKKHLRLYRSNNIGYTQHLQQWYVQYLPTLKQMLKKAIAGKLGNLTSW